MIKGYCITNNDELKKFKWPRVFVAVPRKGEYVASIDNKRVAKVGIIEYFNIDYSYSQNNAEPQIRVELIKIGGV